jgi:hypothetical protein
MRFIFAWSVLLAFILPGMMKFGTFVRWKMDQDWIIRTQCVNVNKPERKCGGKCRLSLLLKLYDETHKPIGREQKQEQRMDLSWFELPVDQALPIPEIRLMSRGSFPVLASWIHHPFRYCVFQPPDLQKNV